ncbi:hypothetical protein cypCar_00002892, partial [Cyprinus carpio]
FSDLSEELRLFKITLPLDPKGKESYIHHLLPIFNIAVILVPFQSFSMGKKLSTWMLLAVFSLLVVKGISQELDLADAIDKDELTEPPPKVDPAGGAVEVKPSLKPVKPTVKEPAKPKQSEEIFTDLFDTTIRPGLLPRTPPSPLRTSVPPRKAQSDMCIQSKF